jgi:hypothetical protein
MAEVIRIRDIARAGTYELGPHEPILLVPHDVGVFTPNGAVHAVREHPDLVEWAEEGNWQETWRQARVSPAELGETQPGQRVLVHLPASDEDTEASENDWWLCDVEAVDGSTSTK